MPLLGTEVNVAGALNTEDVTMSFSNVESGLIVANVGFDFQNALNRIYTLLDGKKVYYITGRSQGSLNLSGVSGPSGLLRAFASVFADVCNAAQNVINMNYSAKWCGAGANPGATNGAYAFHGVVVNQFGGSLSVESMLMNEQIRGMFTYLD